MINNSWLEIDVNRFKQNILALKSKVNTKDGILSVVKANAYGHSLEIIIPALLECGVTWFGVANITEGIAVRKLIPNNCRVLILGYTRLEYYNFLYDYNLTPTVFSYHEVKKLNALGKVINVHVKINTGMNRLGCSYEESQGLLEYISKLEFINVEGLFTHLASSDSNDNFTSIQLSKFDSLLEFASSVFHKDLRSHVCNSSGALKYDNSKYSLARLGIAQFGVAHGIQDSDTELIRPVMSWKSFISHTQRIQKGEPVGYGGKFVAPNDMNIGVIPTGYADGLNRHLTGNNIIRIKDKFHTIVGSVCMDQIMIDLNDSITDVGDEVEIMSCSIGFKNSVSNFAEILKTIEYEIFTTIGERVQRIKK